MQMKWWGWLVIAVMGPVMWGGIIVLLDSLDIISSSNWRDVFIGGVIIIVAGCIAIPLVQKARKKHEDG